MKNLLRTMLLLGALVLAGCQASDSYGLSNDIEQCYKQGYAGMLVRVTAKVSDAGNHRRWVVTTSCVVERNPTKPQPAASPPVKKYNT